MNDSHSESEKENENSHVFDKPGNVRRVIYGFVACCVVLLLADLVVHRHLSFAEGLLPVEGWFGFYAIYGFVAYTLIVAGSVVLRKVVMRSEDYYDG
ncbi:MAG: hypothetical protein QGG64_21725 [Candidatus Latescibacteria bacterium]|jgi:hypothetical protein|nr:hypothetical protein [Candidatus Latescibacterota bacterium]